MLIGGLVVARDAVAQSLMTFGAPHLVRSPNAVLTPTFGRHLDAEAAATHIVTPEGLIAFGLGVTGPSLHFGLRHHTRASFDGANREGNCVEYAELFAWIVNRFKGGIDAHAWVVRSAAQVLGTTLPDPAWRDHDWVLVVVRTGQERRRFYVDPALADIGMGWDIARAVHGEVTTP